MNINQYKNIENNSSQNNISSLYNLNVDYNLFYPNTDNSNITNENINNNLNINYYDIKNIIRNEFAELIIPYQKQLYNNNNMIQEKIDKAESRLQGMINSKSLENINEAARMINLCMKDFHINFQNNNNALINNNPNT